MYRRSMFGKVFWCILSKLFMSQKERDTCKSKTLINKKAKWTSFSLFFIHEYKYLLVSVLGGGKVVLNWPAKYFLARGFRFDMWRKFVQNSLEVHLLILNNTILSSCSTAIRKVMFCRERKLNCLCICVSLELSLSGLFTENQKTVFKMASRLKKLGCEHLYLPIWKLCLLLAPAEYLETPVKNRLH